MYREVYVRAMQQLDVMRTVRVLDTTCEEHFGLLTASQAVNTYIPAMS